MLSKDSIRQRCMEIMERTTGLKLVDLLNNVKELTQADKALVIRNTVSQIPDNQVRLGANTLLLKLLGVEKQETNIDARQVHFTIESREDIGRLENIIGRIEALEDRRDKISGER